MELLSGSKLRYFKFKLYLEKNRQAQETPPPFLGPSSLLIDWHAEENCLAMWWMKILKFSFWNPGHCVLGVREERDHLACYQSKVQKPASMMICVCITAHNVQYWVTCTRFGATYAAIHEVSVSSKASLISVRHFLVTFHLLKAHYKVKNQIKEAPNYWNEILSMSKGKILGSVIYFLLPETYSVLLFALYLCHALIHGYTQTVVQWV